ncbi:DUF4230 domain-containing protein [Sphingomonas abietis]|uniref:DUF4230 domain-containing protein n=1 Tax=Sphingomonas abietis TaxID=3012344 RepID=A0ABY7NJI1_9SPHN|nr:DUF4230 domain-containing protein [Sphingomonas abietis]WBO21634.1 DUF4230 domain-containing protein [Sphingomonas abietis]
MKTVLKVLLGMVLAFVLIAGGAALLGKRAFDHFWSPDPESVASASLQGLQAQSRLTALVASYVAVVTSTQHRFGLSAQRTLIMPGRVRYEVDLSQMKPGDLVWHKDSHMLDVTLPPLMIEGPEIDPARMKAYDGGGLLLKLTDSGEALDQTNQQAARVELIRQAREPSPVAIAKQAARQAVAQSFALPLKAAGMDPNVRVRFQGEAFADPAPFTPMDFARPWQDVIANRH